MATKKKRRRPGGGAPPTRGGAGSSRRQDKKRASREAQDRARKAELRRGAGRRALIGGFVGLLAFVAITWFTQHAPAPKPFSAQAQAAATQAGCSQIETPATNPERTHLSPGATYSYPEHPATSGPHDPTPLADEPRVYTDVGSYRETQAVHSLEHGSVIMYYRPSADAGGLPTAVVDALAPVANGSRATYLIPYPDLPRGTALAYTAWNKLMTCPRAITATDAVTVANGFIGSFACTSNAPEGRRGPGC